MLTQIILLLPKERTLKSNYKQKKHDSIYESESMNRIYLIVLIILTTKKVCNKNQNTDSLRLDRDQSSCRVSNLVSSMVRKSTIL